MGGWGGVGHDLIGSIFTLFDLNFVPTILFTHVHLLYQNGTQGQKLCDSCALNGPVLSGDLSQVRHDLFMCVILLSLES